MTRLFLRPAPALAGSMLVLAFAACAGKSTSSSSTATMPPQTSFSFSPTAPKVAQAVQFTDTSTGSPTSWAWDFGDRGTATTQNPTHVYAAPGTFTVTLTATNAGGSVTKTQSVTVTAASTRAFTVVDTGQTLCYGANGPTPPPAAGQPFYGQDAQFNGTPSSYTLSADGLTVHDNATGLTWQRSPDTSQDGRIEYADKLTFDQAQSYAASLNAKQFGGFSDWRLPTMKELYSLMNFSGEESSPEGSTGSGKPFIDTNYFQFAYGFIANGERIIDSQWITSSTYAADPANMVFGLNLADGRIKGYPTQPFTSPTGVYGYKTFCVICVRGNADYGKNDYVDNGDGTVTDKATGLMWTKGDSAKGMNWQEALDWVQTQNAAKAFGHSDWRLPNAKELHSILDYSRSPDSSHSAAIDSIFSCTGITNEANQADFPWYWTGTTLGAQGGMDDGGVYIAFGRALGYMNNAWVDVHGAGCQRSAPKVGDLSHYTQKDNGYYDPRAPQGDAVRIANYVRLLRDAN